MKVTIKQLKQLIKEEVANLKEDLFYPPPSATELPRVLNSINNRFDPLIAELRSVADYYDSVGDSTNASRARTASEHVINARRGWRAVTDTPGTPGMITARPETY